MVLKLTFPQASRTKYTHLTDQDTSGGGWGNAARAPPGAGGPGGQNEGCWNCGGPHQRKDCPNNDIQNDPMSIVPGYQPQAGGSGGSYGGGAGARGSKYGQEGKERRFDEERQRDGGYGSRGQGAGREREDAHGYSRNRDHGSSMRDDASRRDDRKDRDRESGSGRDRDRERERKRSRSRSPRRERERERDDRRRRDDRDRERERDRR